MSASHPRADRQWNVEPPIPSTGPSYIPNPSTYEEVNSRKPPSLGFFSDTFRTVLNPSREDRVTSRHSPRKDSSSIPPTSNSIAQQTGSVTPTSVRNPVAHIRQRGVADHGGPQAPALSDPLIIDQTTDNKERKANHLNSEHATPLNREDPVANISSRRQLSYPPNVNHPPVTESGSQNREDTSAAKTSGHTSGVLPPPSQSGVQMSMAEKLFQSRQASHSAPVSIQTKPTQAASENLHQTKQEPTTVHPSYQAFSLLGPSQSQLKGGQSMAENMFRSRQDSNTVRESSLPQTIPVAVHSMSRPDYITQVPSQQTTTTSPSSQPRINHPALAELLSSPPAQIQSTMPKETPVENHLKEQDTKGLRVVDTGTEQHGEALVDVKATPFLRPSSTVPQPQMSNKAPDPRAYNRPNNIQPLVSTGPTSSTLEAPVQTQRGTLPLNPPSGYSSKPDSASTPMTINNLPVRNVVQAAQEFNSSHDKRAHNISSTMPTQASTSQARRGQQTAPDSSPLSHPMPEPKDGRSRYQVQAVYSTASQAAPAPLASRHHHTASLPVTLGASVQKSHQKENVPRSAAPTQTHYPTASFQIPATTSGQHASRSNVSLHRTASEETILMTPSSLAQSLMLQPTVSRQSATPSTSSQNARKGIFNIFRRTTGQPPESSQKLESWQPGPSAYTPDSSPGHSKGRETGKEPKQSAHTPPKPISSAVPPASATQPVQIPLKSDANRRGFHPDVFTPFRLVASRRNRAISVASLEAQDGTAVCGLVQ